MDWNRFSHFVETPLRASLAILAVNSWLPPPLESSQSLT